MHHLNLTFYKISEKSTLLKNFRYNLFYYLTIITIIHTLASVQSFVSPVRGHHHHTQALAAVPHLGMWTG